MPRINRFVYGLTLVIVFFAANGSAPHEETQASLVMANMVCGCSYDCAGDLNNDDVVDNSDLHQLNNRLWGCTCENLGFLSICGETCLKGDFNYDDVVDVLDLLILLANWGDCGGIG